MIFINQTFCVLGTGSLIWVLDAELFEGRTRASGFAVAMLTSNLFMFLLTKFFPLLIQSIGAAATYWIFCMNCILLSLFILFFVPETKGRTFSEILKILEGKKGNDVEKVDK